VERAREGCIVIETTPSTGSVISADQLYRYRLWRTWQSDLPAVVWILLNPSTADSRTDDPTLRRCMSFARAWGYGGLVIVNLFALRSTDPRRLRQASDPVGPDNDDHIRSAVRTAPLVVLGWGARGNIHGRSTAVLSIIDRICAPHCLGSTRDGHPRHPLYLANDRTPRPYPTTTAST
jgi:hypothetical protein